MTIRGYCALGSLIFVGLLAGCSSADGNPSRGGDGNAGDGDGFDNGGGSGGLNSLNGLNGNQNSGSGGQYVDPNWSDGCTPRDASVWFVVDGSGSMDQGFGTGTRWTTLRSALMDPDGVIPQLQGIVDFGMVLYDGPIDIGAFLGMPTGACPQLVTVPTAPDNFPPIDAAYPQAPLGGSTPTHYAMQAARQGIIDQAAQPDQSARSVYIVLATDGEPNDFCQNIGTDAAAAVIDQTQFAFDEGVKTFVISLADDAALNSHLQQVATVGGTGYPPFVPTDKQALNDAMRSIVHDATGCDLIGPQ